MGDLVEPLIGWGASALVSALLVFVLAVRARGRSDGRVAFALGTGAAIGTWWLAGKAVVPRESAHWIPYAALSLGAVLVVLARKERWVSLAWAAVGAMACWVLLRRGLENQHGMAQALWVIGAAVIGLLAWARAAARVADRLGSPWAELQLVGLVAATAGMCVFSHSLAYLHLGLAVTMALIGAASVSIWRGLSAPRELALVAVPLCVLFASAALVYARGGFTPGLWGLIAVGSLAPLALPKSLAQKSLLGASIALALVCWGSALFFAWQNYQATSSPYG